MNPQQKISRRRVPAHVLALAAVLAASLAGWAAIAVAASPARAAGQGLATQVAARQLPAGVERDLGTWNYDQPNSQTKTNIAVVSCPPGTSSCVTVPPITIPQVGTVVFSGGPDGTVTGRTDQGCTWRFTPRPGGLELSPGRPQTCFNRVIGSSYTMTRWSVRFSGRYETEYITAVSRLSYGNFDFVLQDGRRTKADSAVSLAAVRRFTGTWQYTPADPGTGVNIKTTVYPAAARPVESPLTGQITFTPGPGGLVSARTADGCRWTLAVAGNTAELRPGRQACSKGGTTTTMTFWSIASDGRQQVSIVAGTDGRGGSYLAANTTLTRVRCDGLAA